MKKLIKMIKSWNQHIKVGLNKKELPYLGIIQVLAYFKHVFTLPFVYSVEVNSQNGLLEMFPCLFNDLKCNTIDTLKDYQVGYPHIQVTQPTTNAAQQLLKKMCEDAATVSEWQAGWEYGFGEGVYVTSTAT